MVWAIAKRDLYKCPFRGVVLGTNVAQYKKGEPLEIKGDIE